MAILPFGPLRPDIAETDPGVSRIMRNVVLRKDSTGLSIQPMPGLVALSTSAVIPDTIKGAQSGVTRAGVYQGFLGTTTNIYKVNNNFTVTSLGSGYNVPAGDAWSALQFGDVMLFSNTTDGMLAYNIESGGVFALVSNTFKPRSIALIFDCLFGFDCLDATGARDNRLMRNSDANDYTNFTTGIANYQPMPDGEALLGGSELSDGYAVVIQRNALRILTRVADKSLYVMNKMADGIGATNTQGIVGIRGASFFMSNEGPYMVTQEGANAIGTDKVSKTFLDKISGNGLLTIEGAYDPVRRRVAWRYQSAANGSATVFTDMLIYDIRLDEFIESDQSTAAIFQLATPGYTLEDLDQFGALDSLPYSLDDRAWFGGEPQFGGVTADGKIGFFNGANLEAVAETSTNSLSVSSLVNSARPVTDDASALLSLGVRDNLYTAPTYTTEAAIQPSGRAMTRGRGKNISFKVRHPAGGTWVYDRGVDDLDTKSGGPR